MKKRTMALALAGTLALGIGVGASALGDVRAITGQIDPSVRVTLNGSEKTFWDEQGNQVYPITFNGSVYIPVRGAADLVDLPVRWDGDSRTVVLGQEVSSAVSLLECPSSGNDQYTSVLTGDDLAVSAPSGPVRFAGGIAWNIWNAEYSSGKDRAKYYDVTGYKSLTLTAWSDVTCTVYLYDKAGNVISTFMVPADTLAELNLNIEGAEKIGFAADGEPGAYGTLKLFEPTAKP